MLKKLMKYDLIYTINKNLIIFYILSIIFGTLTRIFSNFDEILICNIIKQICNGTTITLMINIIINWLLRTWARFSQNLYGSESYLTHTLPVKKSTLYDAKILCAILSIISSTAVIILTILIAYYSKENFERFINMFVWPGGNAFDLCLIIFLIIIELINVLQIGYTGILLGHRRINLKIVWSLITGLVVYAISQLITFIAIYILSLFNKDLNKLLFTANAKNTVSNLDILKPLMYYCLILFILFIIVIYFINKKLLNKGVNVN